MLENILKDLVEEICKETARSTDLPQGIKDTFSDYSLKFIDYSWVTHFKLGPIARGSDFYNQEEPYTEAEEEELKGIYFAKNQQKLDEIVEKIKTHLPDLTLRVSSPEIEFGRDGLIYFCVKFMIEGKFVKSDNGENYWVDYTGNIDKEQLVLNTPDVERYFNSIEEVEAFIKNFEYTNNDPF